MFRHAYCVATKTKPSIKSKELKKTSIRSVNRELKKLQEHAKNKEEDTDDVCCICLCPHSLESCTLPCSHRLHTTCLAQLKRQSPTCPTCPLCRAPVSTPQDFVILRLEIPLFVLSEAPEICRSMHVARDDLRRVRK